MTLNERIIAKTLRVPIPTMVNADGHVATRKLDIALMRYGFKLDGDTFGVLSRSGSTEVGVIGRMVLRAVKSLVGAKAHNPYFKDFPDNVPDTIEFWLQCMEETMLVGEDRLVVPANLLDCPSYGTPQHDYDEMLEAHARFIPSNKDRVTLLTLGHTLAFEVHEMYLKLAGSQIPLNESDRLLLADVALEIARVGGEHPTNIPIRENRAIINEVRVRKGYTPIVDTYTDILRLACGLSHGDVTLETPTKFLSFPKKVRRLLTAAITSVDPSKVADILRHKEQWKRLFERLHPTRHDGMSAVLRAAYGVGPKSPLGVFESFMAEGHVVKAAETLRPFPGHFFRKLDYMLRSSVVESQINIIFRITREIADKVSLRVLLSLREHFENRNNICARRVFVNRKGRAWTTDNNVGRLSPRTISNINAILDRAISAKIPEINLNPNKLHHALVLSAKSLPDGLNVVPRGTWDTVGDHEVLRLFAYWKEASRTTDYDLSANMFGADFQDRGHVSWTNYHGHGHSRGWATYSGDITSARNGASEFIDIVLDKVPADVYYVVPMLNIYSGEEFNEVEEAFMGFMGRDLDQKGKPFEPRTVVTKSDLLGGGTVALPFILCREKSEWAIKWAHLYLAGAANMNMCEGHKVSAADLLYGILGRTYLTGHYLMSVCDNLTANADEETTDIKDILK